MKIHIHNLKFRSQIILIFLSVSLVISSAGGMAYYHISKKLVTDNFFSVSQNAMHQIENTLETRLEIINYRAENMLINHTFGVVLQNYLNRPDSANTVYAQSILSDYLKDFERGERLIHSSCIFTSRGEFDNYVHVRRRDFDFKESPFYKIYEEDETLLAKQWLYPMENYIFADSEVVIPCIRRFTVLGSSSWQYFVYQLDQSYLRQLLMGRESFFDDIVILDGKGRKILGGEAVASETLLDFWENQGTGIIHADDGSTSYIVESCLAEINGWKVFGLKSQEEMLKSLRNLQYRILRMLVVLLAVCVVLILWISSHMTDALKRLERQMLCARNGDFAVRFFYNYKDEIGSLSRSFNFMIQEIQALIEKQKQMIEDLRTERDNVARVQKQKRKAELKALQAQINPHFLYNTLNAITWQAMDQGMNDVAQMASSLGKFFRLSLSHGAEIISLFDEVEHVRSYLNIQQIRYQDKLQYEIDIPERFLTCQVPKLILQPLVENAIYHGIKEKKGGGKICITAWEDCCGGVPSICLGVWDDGAGIPAEQLEVMNESLRGGVRTAGGGYGVYNVNERLRLYYGSEFGISYESAEGEYTRAILEIPVSYQEVE